MKKLLITSLIATLLIFTSSTNSLAEGINSDQEVGISAVLDSGWYPLDSDSATILGYYVTNTGQIRAEVSYIDSESEFINIAAFDASTNLLITANNANVTGSKRTIVLDGLPRGKTIYLQATAYPSYDYVHITLHDN